MGKKSLSALPAVIHEFVQKKAPRALRRDQTKSAHGRRSLVLGVVSHNLTHSDDRIPDDATGARSSELAHRFKHSGK